MPATHRFLPNFGCKNSSTTALSPCTMNDYRSHVTVLDKPDKKGKTRYCCVTCGHQFTCSGRRRIIQHIIGRDYCLGKERNIVPCPKPLGHLKEALLAGYLQKDKDTEQNLLLSPCQEKLMVGKYDVIETVDAVSSVSSSFHSSSVTSDSTLCNEFFSELFDWDIIDSMFSSDKEDEQVSSRPCNQSMIQFERSVLNFFSVYNIPYSAIHDPFFLHFVDVIQTCTDSLYTPFIADELADKLTEKLT
jgi:hypothetical protein